MPATALKFIEHRLGLRKLKIIDFAGRYSTLEHLSVCHELLLVLSGRVILHMPQNLEFKAVSGDFLLVPDGIVHRDEFALDKGLRVLMVQFVWDAPEFFGAVDNRRLAGISYAVRTEARRRLQFTLEQWNNAQNELAVRCAALQIRGILMLLYDDIVGRNADNAPQRRNAAGAMREVKLFLEGNYASPISLRQAAEKIGVSTSYLSRMFHREYGVSFNEYLLSLRLNEAKILLTDTHLQVAEIAARCGFHSSSYFIRTFRSHFGTTPNNYTRRQSPGK